MNMSKSRVVAVAVAGVVCNALANPPLVSNVTLVQPQGTQRAMVSYETDGPGIATFQFRTNGVDICHSEIVRSVTGDINIFLPQGTHSFTWDAKRDFPEQVITNLTVEVTLWATNNPPMYCAISLVGSPGPALWYGKQSEVPFGLTNSVWKKDFLLLRKILATEGRFTILGAPVGEMRSGNSTDGSDDLRLVRITKPFYIGVFQVTQRQWQNIAGTVRSMPSFFKNPDDWEERPVEQVAYTDIRGTVAQGCNWPVDGHAVHSTSFMGLLREKTGNLMTFDLPTDAQWEYACRAETTGAWNNGTTITHSTNDPNLPLVGRCSTNGGNIADEFCGATNGTAKVGSYLPNAWGLYDMHGNVFEFCLDWFTIDTAQLWGDDPTGPASGTQRCLRGGRYGNNHRDSRAAFRYPGSPTSRSNNGWGFRVAAPAEVFIAQ